MKLFTTALWLNFKKILNKIIILIVLIITTFLLGKVVVNYSVERLESQELGIKIGILNEDDDPTMELMVGMILDDYLTGENFDFMLVDDEKIGVELLGENEISALVVFPEGFLMSVVDGYNFPPKITYNTSDLLTKTLIESSVKSLESAMRVLQPAVYTIFDTMESDEVTSEVILKANLILAQYITDYEKIFKENELIYTKSVSVGEFYLVSFVIFMLSLTSCLFISEMNFRENILTVRFISVYNKGFFLYYLSRIFWVGLVYIIVFILLAVLMGFGGFLSIVSAVNGAVLFTLSQALLFNIFKGLTSTVQLNFLINTGFLFVSGGIMPSLMLPKSINIIGKFTPIYHIRNLVFSSVLELKETIIYNLLIILVNIILYFVLYILSKKMIKEAKL